MMRWTDITSDDTARAGRSVTVNATDRAELMADLTRRLLAGQGFSLATLNLDHVVKLRRDPAFLNAYAAHTHVTADGNPIVWVSRLAGHDVSLVPGSELIEPVAALAAKERVSVGLFGATPRSLEATAEALRKRYPDLSIAFCKAPAMGFDPCSAAADAAIAEIGESGARVVFLALGAPKQERFAARASAALPNVGFLSIGAGLDFVSGAQVRAPRLVRRLALEWAWRLLGNPRRLAARYGASAAILPGLLARASKARRS